MTTNKGGPGDVARMLAIDVALPTGAYYALHAMGVSTFAALALSGVIPLARTLLQFARERTLNGLALVVLATNVAGMILTFVSGDARMMIAKDSIGSGVTGVVILVSAATARPLLTAALRPFLTNGDAARETAWERLMTGPGRFSSILRRASVVWGCAFVLESAARVVGAFTLPIDTMVWLGTVIFVAALLTSMVLTGVVTSRAGALMASETELVAA
ncbi:hypothetical protein OG943_44315 [Amycolatopsis sp. NBC_00345]|uniref:VC0807 family protein n=1 Tax=Amycolatopsis sp. NBC_00345 TaxID=2975955 RepID=UPI002E253CA9